MERDIVEQNVQSGEVNVESGEGVCNRVEECVESVSVVGNEINGVGDVSGVARRVTLNDEVLRHRAAVCRREPNVNCRVESFGRMCSKFDRRRRQWVVEMGFGGLLNLVGLHLPRMLCYWLMTRVEPSTEMFNDGNGKEYRLSSNQVRWVLGIPKGSEAVPLRVVGDDALRKAFDIEERYGKVISENSKASGGVRCRKGFPITPKMLERAESEWDESQEEEFKLLFLLLALQMILCPTQCPRLPKDLLPAVTCAMQASKFNWCDLVLKKLMSSVRQFRTAFDEKGFATGCGGCAIFLAIFYLDRINRNPIEWGVFPRLKVWSKDEIRKASNEDNYGAGGDFGKLGMLDVAYGEFHPREARDTEVGETESVSWLDMWLLSEFCILD